MVILDTNVVSELMRPSPHPAVLSWTNSQATSTCFITATTQAEILARLAIMPLGQRQKELVAKAQTMFDRCFAGRILPFDSFGAVEYATIWALRRVAGRPISEFDCQIAAVGRAKLASVATRNVRDFEGCGVEILNPWDLPK